MLWRTLSALVIGVPVVGCLALACSTETVVFDNSSGTASTGGGSASSSSQGGSGGGGGSSSSSSSVGGGTAACTGPGQCALVTTTCCGPCGQPQLADMTSVLQADVEAYYGELCAEPEPCPDCPQAPNPNLFAFCDAGSCAAGDVSQHPVSACSDDTECVLRNGLRCCEGCEAGAHHLVALNQNEIGALLGLTCEGDVACRDCEPQYPPGAAAFCNKESGHCEVVWSDTGNGG